MNVRQISAFAIALLFLHSTAYAKFRTWTDAQQRTVVAEFVRINNGAVVLKVNTGKVLSVPFFQLSDEDQEFLKGELEAKGQEDLLPRPPKSGFDAERPLPLPGAAAPGIGPGAGAVPGAMPPGGYAPGRMPPGAGGPGAVGPGAVGHNAMPPGGGVPGAMPPGAMNPGAGYSPTGVPPGTGYPAGGGYPGPGMGMPSTGTSPTQTSSINPPGYPATTEPIGVSPVTPGMGNQPFPQMQWVETKICDKCKKEVPSTSKAGDKCPHCGTYWGYEQGQDGSKTYAVGYRAGKVVGGVIFLIALIGAGIKKLAGRLKG